LPPQVFEIKTIEPLPRFGRELKSLSLDLQKQAKTALELLKANPYSGRLRLEKLSGYKNPNIYTVHVTANHSHKISFEIEGTNAILRRIATHKEIDRTP
jgi:mRNA-degrading endonuclease RelE of RelBE toxin-antitoxin system